MQQNKTLIFLLLLFCNILLCSFNTDSASIEKAVSEYYYTRPDSMLRVLDRAEQNKTIPVIRVNFLRAIVYDALNMKTMQESCLRRVLSSADAASDSRLYLRTLSMLVESLQTQGKYNECIPLAIEGIEMARKYDDRLNEYSLLSAIGILSFYVGKNEDGYEYLNEVIRKGTGSTNPRELSYVSYAYGTLMNRLISDERYEEALQAAKDREALLKRIADMSGIPPGYIEQQKAYLYAKVANLYQSMGETAKAEEAYRNFMQTDYSKKVESGYNIIPYLSKAGRNREVLKKTTAIHTLWENTDTVSNQYRYLLEYEAEAEGALGNYRRKSELYKRALILADSINTRLNNSRVHELATIFDVNEKEAKIKDEQAKAERNFLLFVGVVVILFLLCVLIIVVYRNLLRVRRRNQIATRQIDELLEQREELRRIYAENHKKETVSHTLSVECLESSSGSVENTIEAMEETIGDDTPESVLSYQTFLRMEQTIMERQLFLNPRLNRDELLRITGINKNDFGNLIQNYARASNLNNYLNRLRVEYSVKLIKENKNYSIEAIAREAGFNSRATFYRAFYRQFGMTPTEYINSLNI